MLRQPHPIPSLSLIPIISLLTAIFLSPPLLAQQRDLSQGIPAVVDFSQTLQEWDGFGFTYIETAQTRDYATFSQDFGGFSRLNEKRAQEINRLIFGEDGLKVGLVKIFLDPHHQKKANGRYDHETSTQALRGFVREGLDLTRSRGNELSILSTLYGAPAYATQQELIGGRDLNPKYADDLAKYMVDWVKYLREIEAFPVDAISLHSGGNLWQNWDGQGQPSSEWDPYNLYWPPEQIVDFLTLIPPILAKEGLEEVKISNGEAPSWEQFSKWGCAAAIYEDDAALRQLGLITSQGLGEAQSVGIDLLRSKRPDLHAWTTASRWKEMEVDFVQDIHNQIYSGKVNGIIPEAGIQLQEQWRGGKSPFSPMISVQKNGAYQIDPRYYFYKQVSRAGQPGTSVVGTSIQDSKLSLIGFGQNGTNAPDAFVLVNGGMEAHEKGDAVDIRIGQAIYHFNLTDYEANYTYRIGETSPQAQRKTELRSLVQYAKKRVKNGYILEVGIPLISGRGVTMAVSRVLRADVKVHDRSYFHSRSISWNDNQAFKVSESGDGDATFVASPPTIDGLKEELWQGATTFSARSPESTDFGAQIHALNTKTMLYFLIEITEPTAFAGQEVSIEVTGSEYTEFDAFRTTNDGEQYRFVGRFKLDQGFLRYNSPSHSVTTFYGVK